MRKLLRQLTIYLLIIFVLTTAVSIVYAKEITDMTGKKVIVSDQITKVYSCSPPTTFLLYTIAPDLLVGKNVPVSDKERPYFSKHFKSLPLIGGFYGQGRTPNIEMIIKAKPDIIITWSWNRSAFDRKSSESMEKLQFPVINTFVNHISDYSKVFLFFGKLLNKEKRGKELADYSNKVVIESETFISSIPENEKPKVYYAEGKDGLYTESSGSMHSELISVAGGTNVIKGEPKTGYGMERISIEQVMIYDPDIILTREVSFFKIIYNDPKWKNFKAVKNKSVYQIPLSPINWFDRPPSFMRILGLQWILKCFYPDKYNKDLIKETEYFLKLFFNIDLSENEIKKIIYSY
ncbi:MAG: ABC transporter substrate-binding protein [Spirochaetes bacterium]|nr:ABC transporter substrate-binding protein [Spirochaetota bacterium]